jgi:hypothetical protein|tara:strand:+ start:3420 stop:3554 length:135 start_codon:yes stop_codon:yes gene_type:complete
MELEMANEFKKFLATLEPIWEDTKEFEWLKEKMYSTPFIKRQKY